MSWAGINVLDSVLVKRYDKHPMVMMWNQAYYSMIVLALLALIFPIRSEWIVPLLVVGVGGYVGDSVFFVALKYIDVSVTNIAWVIMSIFLAIGGFILFQESWTWMQSVGVVLVIAGILILSLWHSTIGNPWMLLLLPLLALLYTPFYLVQKAALLAGEGTLPVLFWSLLGRESISVSMPLFLPFLRRHIKQAYSHTDSFFYCMNALVITLFFGATYFTTKAFDVGPVSLVGIVGNIQPFFVLFLAWICTLFIPSLAPKELLTSQSLVAKISSFTIVFAGLALLAIYQ